jgi:hypothetical protein
MKRFGFSLDVRNERVGVYRDARETVVELKEYVECRLGGAGPRYRNDYIRRTGSKR